MVSLVARFYDAWGAVLDGVATGNDTITSGQIDVFCGRGEHALSSAIRTKKKNKYSAISQFAPESPQSAKKNDLFRLVDAVRFVCSTCFPHLHLLTWLLTTTTTTTAHKHIQN